VELGTWKSLARYTMTISEVPGLRLLWGDTKPPKHTICKALQTRKFLLADHNDGNDFDSNPNAIQEG